MGKKIAEEMEKQSRFFQVRQKMVSMQKYQTFLVTWQEFAKYGFSDTSAAYGLGFCHKHLNSLPRAVHGHNYDTCDLDNKEGNQIHRRLPENGY